MESKTYSEKRGKENFNWVEEIKKQMLNSPDKKDHLTLTNMAGTWVTCAVGNQCDIIPRSYGGVPADFELSRLGIYFSTKIENENWVGALGILAEIEHRSAVLISRIKNSK